MEITHHLRSRDGLSPQDVSLDVVSLFTEIPVDLAIKVVEKRLNQDVSLPQRTSLLVEDIIDLLSFCLSATYFVFEGTYYQQVFGTAMGSPVSVVILNLVMEGLEQRALALDVLRVNNYRWNFLNDCLKLLD